MFDDSFGRGERQARGVIILVLLIEALWVFFHKYLPLDAGLWTLQGDVVREHLTSQTNDGLSLISFPTANILSPLVSAVLGFFLDGEIVTRLLAAGVGILGRGLVMLSLLRVLRVRDEAVYYLVPVFTWSGIFWSGSIPYLLGETFALMLIIHFLKQDHPRRGTYITLMVGSAIIAMFHALAFVFCAVLFLAVANEQRRSVHLSQGWLSNINSVASLVVPGLGIIALRLLSPAPIFTYTTSGFHSTEGWDQLFANLTVAPYVPESALPTFDILCLLVTAFVVIIVLATFIRAFLLPMEEVSWQSRSAKLSGTLLIIAALCSPLFTNIGIQTSAFIWSASFLALAGAYSRGPAVRRNIVDRLLNALGFIAMLIAGSLNAYNTNRGSEAAYDIRTFISESVTNQRESAYQEENINSLSFRYVIDSTLYSHITSGLTGTVSYSTSAPLYFFGSGKMFDSPELYQPKAGIVVSDGSPLSSPHDVLHLSGEAEFESPRLRILAALPNGTASSRSFGSYASSLADTTGVNVDKGTAKFQFLIGRLSAKRPHGLAQR